jgi:hypothetical protein
MNESQPESQPSVSQQLWAEALRLGGAFEEAKKQIAERVLEVVGLVQQLEEQSEHPRARELFTGIREKHKTIAHRGGQIVDAARATMVTYRDDNYTDRIQKLLELNANVDPVKIADEELLAELKRAWDTVLDVPDGGALRIASIQITQFSQMFYLADAMSTFLGYPSTFRRVLDAARSLAKAAVLDVTGTAIPFLGTLMTVFDLFEPRIDKVTEDMLNSARNYERNLEYDSRLDEILAYANFVEENILLAGQSLESIRTSFARDELWLEGVLTNAARS